MVPAGKNIPLKSAALILIIAAILFFGLRPKGYNPENNILYDYDKNCISFREGSTALTEKGIFDEMPESGELSIEFAISPQRDIVPEFRFIILAYAESSRDQLLTGQWDDALVIMNGDDYSNRRRTPKIYARMNDEDELVHVIISSSAGGTCVYLNGQLAACSKTLQIKLPLPLDDARLILGNSISNSSQWLGELYSLAFYSRIINANSVKQHYDYWVNTNKIFNSEQESSYLLFNLDNFSNNLISDNTGRDTQIILPEKRPLLELDILSLPGHFSAIGRNLYADIIINFIGFIPFGFCLLILLRAVSRRKVTRLVVITVLSGFMLSLIIEIIQVWLPLRSSSLLDLILNTAGTAAGSLAGLKLMSRSKRNI